MSSQFQQLFLHCLPHPCIFVGRPAQCACRSAWLTGCPGSTVPSLQEEDSSASLGMIYRVLLHCPACRKTGRRCRKAHAADQSSVQACWGGTGLSARCEGVLSAWCWYACCWHLPDSARCVRGGCAPVTSNQQSPIPGIIGTLQTFLWRLMWMLQGIAPALSDPTDGCL